MPLTEEEENQLDECLEKNGTLEIGIKLPNGQHYYIRDGNIYLYGEVNLNNPEDIRLIKSKPLTPEEVYGSPAVVYAGLDYSTGIIHADEEGFFRWFHTWDNVKWFMHNHVLIGKPKRILIFNLEGV